MPSGATQDGADQHAPDPDGLPGPDGGSPGEEVVDARGLACPLPVIRLAAAARAAAPGTVLTVLWTDPAARYDVPAWARMRGHTVLGTGADAGGEWSATTVRTHEGPVPAGTDPS